MTLRHDVVCNICGKVAKIYPNELPKGWNKIKIVGVAQEYHLCPGCSKRVLNLPKLENLPELERDDA